MVFVWTDALPIPGEVSLGLARSQTFTDLPKDPPYLKLKLGRVGTIFLAGTA